MPLAHQTLRRSLITKSAAAARADRMAQVSTQASPLATTTSRGMVSAVNHHGSLQSSPVYIVTTMAPPINAISEAKTPSNQRPNGDAASSWGGSSIGTSLQARNGGLPVR